MTLSLLACLVALAARPAAAQEQDEPPDTVRLAFAWPEGGTATVRATRLRERTENGVPSAARTTLDYELALQRSDSGFVVRYSGFRGAGLTAAGGTPEIASRVADFTPSYIVSSAGGFVGLGDSAMIRALVDSLTAPLQAHLAEHPAAAEFLATLTSDEMLRSTAEQDWNVLVGTWAGAEFEIGRMYGSRVVERFAVFGGVDLPMDYEFTAVQRVPCDSADAGLSCVALQMTSRPDPEVVGTVVRETLVRVMPADSLMLSEAEFDVLNTVHLVARPESLVPYRLAVTREITLTLPDGGRMSEYRERDVSEKRFFWQPASGVSRPASLPGSPATP